MAEQNKVQLWVRRDARALRSASLFSQPVASRASGINFSAKVPASTADPDVAPPFRWNEGILYFVDGANWKSLRVDASPARPATTTDTVAASRGDVSSAAVKEEIQWDADANFFYVSPVGVTEWQRIPLGSGSGVMTFNGMRMRFNGARVVFNGS